MRLREPIEIGGLRLRNRVVFTAHLTGYATDGLPTARHTAYYGARAAGGAGLVITEEHSVHPDDRPYEKVIRGHDPAVVPGYRALVTAVHAHGAAVLAQLNHNGPQSSGLYSRRPVWGPSAIADPMFREVPVEMGEPEMAELVAGYSRTARHCVEGGFDGVELQCSHASLLRCFLSPATNRRTDAHGGPLADRARLLLRVIDAVRAEIGDRVLGVRIAGHEGVPGGIDLDDGVALARLLEATGAVDYLNTSIGVATASLHLVEPSMHVEPGYATFIPSAFRRAVALPVIAVGRFTTHAQAERALAEGHCDLVGVARGQIADPGFVNGPDDPVTTCVGCNQECVGRVGVNQPLACAVNPRAGREGVPLPEPTVLQPTVLQPTVLQPTVLQPAGPKHAGPQRVLVVGGGPAGLRAAATTAARGHRVRLCEAAAEVGGQLRLAARAPGRAELGHVVRDLLAQCRTAGVEIRTGATVDPGFVARSGADAVVLATGSRPRRRPGTLDVRDVLGGAVVAGSVLVVDELGFHHATSVAELLAGRGCAVEIVTPALVVGQDLGLTLDREDFRRRAHAAGIRLTTDRFLSAVNGVNSLPCTDGVNGVDGVNAVVGVPRMVGVDGAASTVATLVHHPTGRVETREVDAVVVAAAGEPVDDLWTLLRDGPGKVVRIGDCLAPRRMGAAIADGYRVAVNL